MEYTVSAFAKINISIDIKSILTDGYHEVEMVMQSVQLHDDVKLTENSSGRLTVKTNLRYLPVDDSNIALRAAKLFFENSGIKCNGMNINIFKRIPVGAGMAGGSTDGAAVLRGLNEMYSYGFSTEKLTVIGKRLGSDVPFCIIGGTALAMGRGDVLTILPPLPDCSVIVCKPQFSISTEKLFSKIKCEKIQFRPDTDGIINALIRGSLPDTARRMYNVFEDVLPETYAKEIHNIKDRLNYLGALGTNMTGTGSAVFGIFDNKCTAEQAYFDLSKDYRECYLTKPIGNSEINRK